MINHTHKILFRLYSLLFVLLISACTDGERGFVPLPVEPEEEKLADIRIIGAGVKGPMINAEVNVYKLELDKGKIHLFNVALKRWYELLEENEVTINDTTVTVAGISETEVIKNIQTTLNQYAFTTQLLRLKDELEQAESFAQADEIVIEFLKSNQDVSEGQEISSDELARINNQSETNTKVLDEVEKLKDKAATLADYKAGIKEIKSLTDELEAAESFSAARSILIEYKDKETDLTKQAGFDSAIAALDNYRTKSNSFDISAIRRAFENDVYNVFLPTFDIQNNPYSRQNLLELNELLDEASSNEDAKTHLQNALAKESNAQLKTAIAQLIAKITTLQNLKLDLLGRESIYHKFGIKAAIDSAPQADLQQLFEDVNLLFSNNLENSFTKSLIVEDDEGNKENLLSFGVTSDQGILPGLRIDQYRGFIYMEVKSIAQTVDLNSGRPPIISKLGSIFHTDDIVGNGAENSEDKTVYFILNGIVQRDSDGKLITDRSNIEFTSADELLEVRPLFTATPFTQLGLQVALEKMKTLKPFVSDSNNDGLLDKMISKDVLSNALSDASNLIVESLGIGMQTENNIFRTPAIRLPEMKYNKQSELAAIQHRYSLENFSAFIQDIKSRKDISGVEVLEALSVDLADNQLDAKILDEPIEALAGIPEYLFLLTSDPAEKLLPDTSIPVSDIYYVMNDELATTQPEHPLSGFSVKRSELSSSSPKGGRDSDGDSVLDNEDQFPDDPSSSRALSPGYPGVWSVSVDNSEYGYMPFEEDFVFSLNKEQVEGSCTNTPCIGLGNIAVELTAQYDLIKAPANNDFRLSAFNQTNNIGFSAFATVPGNYLVKATFSKKADQSQESTVAEQSYEVIVPVQVINPRSIELRFDPEVPVPGKITKVQFKATKGICSLYAFCSDLNVDLTDNIPDYLDISLLADIFSVEQTLARNGEKFNYSSVESNADSNANLSNIEVNDILNVKVKFNAGTRSFIAKTTGSNSGGTVDSDSDGVADTVDIFPNDANCSLEKDGILDSNLDGDINNLDEPKCFASFFQETDIEPLDVNFLNETWYYSKDWDYIVRKNKYETGFNGLILLPTLSGTKQFVEHFIVDETSKRVYFAYKNAAIDYFQLESQEIITFDEGLNFAGINSLHLVGTYLLAEYNLGTGKTVAKLFNKSGNLAAIQGAEDFPKPLEAINLQIDGLNFLTTTNNLLTIDWQIERTNPDKTIAYISPSLSNDGVTLLEGQTAYADVVKVNLTFNADNDRQISISEKLFVMNFDDIDFTTEDFYDTQPITVQLENYDASAVDNNHQRLFVNWYINGESSEDFRFAFSDLSYPFILESNNFEFGDIIRADIVLSHGNSSLIIDQIQAVVLGDLNELLPVIEETTKRTVTETLDYYFELSDLTANNQFYSVDTFLPVWKINGVLIKGENGYTFPQLSSTRFRYGDEISVSYSININGRSVQTDDVVAAVIAPASNLVRFNLQPKVAELGESISLDTSVFTDDVLETIEAIWRINSVIDKDIKAFTYPADRLKYGDSVELLIVPLGGQIQTAFTHIAKAAVGLNLFSLNEISPDLEHDLDSDNDGIPNRQDFFRHDANCSVAADGYFDDLDFDRVSDLDEIKIYNTNPNQADSDNDGLSDAEEINKTLTNPLLADTDNDGYEDGVEQNLGTDPLDPNEPNIGLPDNDFDGLPNEDELLNKTRVNVFDTDSDGLSDWYEINVENPVYNDFTLPLNADSDGDGLADGLEVRVTQTNPMNADTDGDGLSDGQEILLGLNPLLPDSDDNGVNDGDEAGFDFSLQLSEILYISDLPNYRVIADHRKKVEPGTCYSSYISQDKPEFVTQSHEPQISPLSQQQLAFASSDWSQVLRYDAVNSVFLSPVDLADYAQTELTSIEYKVEDFNKIYLGFADGSIRIFDSNTNSVSDRFTADPGYAVTKLIDQGTFLIAEQVVENNQIIHSAFDKLLPDLQAKARWNSDYSYQYSSWLDNSRTTLFVVDPQHNENGFVRESFNSNPSNPLTQVDLINAPSALNGPLFVETVSGNFVLRFGSGQSYNLSSSNWLANTLAPFSYGFSHESHRVLALKNSSLLQMTTLSTLNDAQYWRFTTQLENAELITVVPVGAHLLAITSAPTSGDTASAIDFQKILLGDEDANSMPDWWQRLSSNLTPDDFINYRLVSDAVVPDYPNGDPDIDVTVQPPVLVDSDNDGICDHWEINMFGTNPSKADSDDDGASDGQELGIDFSTPLNCGVKPKFKDVSNLDALDPNGFVSDPNNPDTDNDGLMDGHEFFVSFTNPLLIDSDLDDLTDYQEVHITLTNPLIANSSMDSDGDKLTDAEELNKYHTNHLLKDSDDDGFTDFEEVIELEIDEKIFYLGTNPNNSDTDGDGLSDFEELNPDLDYLDPNDANYATEIEKYKSNPSKSDTDGDGLRDDIELNKEGENAFNTYPTIIDSDEDGLSDKVEFDFIFVYPEAAEGIPDDVLVTLNPREKDTDSDGICDVWEVNLFNTNPAEADTDNDGLTDVEELGIIIRSEDGELLPVNCSLAPQTAPISAPLQRDTDDDGVHDGDEVTKLNTDPRDRDSDDNGITDGNEDFDNDGLTNAQELYITLTLPNNPDTDGDGTLDALDDEDGDGLTNIAEINTYNTDPRNPDTNGNGYDDGEEVSRGLDPIAEDTDDDGISDADEIADGTDPLNPDTDNDGLTEGEEETKRTLPLDPDTDHDLLKDGADEAPLTFDSDRDGIPDGVEVNFLSTDPRDADSDNDGILDGDEAWVFAFEVIPGATPEDPPVLTDTFLQVGVMNAKEDLNNRKSQANWPKHNAPNPITFEDNGLDRRVYDLYDFSDDTKIVGRLFVRMFSNPSKPDTDGDGLTDATELTIETAHGNGFNLLAPGINNTFNPLKSNVENFTVSDPWASDTDLNGIPDGLEDVDGDYLTNTLDQNNQSTDVLNRDTDGDGIPDGIEVLILGTNPLSADTDGDGISDRNELNQFSLGDIREVPSDEFCLDTETRLTYIAGKDYCALIEFNSYPTLSDSDNDGTADSQVNPDNTVTLDYFPLDATCSSASDGFENSAIGREQCFSSWMSESSSIDVIQASEWQTTGGQDRADIVFYSQGWDKIVRFNTLTSRYLPPIPVDAAETIVGMGTVSQSTALFILYSNGRLDSYHLETGVTQTINDLSQPGLNPDHLLALENGDLLIQYKDASNLSSLYLYDQNGIGLDNFSALNTDIEDAAFLCETNPCGTLGYLYTFEKDANGINTNLGRIEINLSAKVFNPVPTLANTLDQFAELKGPVRLSQNKDRVYLASGQKLELDLQDSDHSDSLAITHEPKTYTSFYDFLETRDHLVGIIDYDISGIPGAPTEPASRNGLIAQDSLVKANTYLLPPVSFDERIQRLLAYGSSSPIDIAIVSLLDDSVLIEKLGVLDNDGDGMPRIYEHYYGLNDDDASDKFKDPDADGFTNIEEYLNGTNPLSDKFGDPDNDGLSNIDEWIYGTDPLNPDTDGDGFDDLFEVLNESDPTDAASQPGN